ncbi:MAG: hypothetical protein ABI743_08310 [bacterium]
MRLLPIFLTPILGLVLLAPAHAALPVDQGNAILAEMSAADDCFDSPGQQKIKSHEDTYTWKVVDKKTRKALSWVVDSTGDAKTIDGAALGSALIHDVFTNGKDPADQLALQYLSDYWGTSPKETQRKLKTITRDSLEHAAPEMIIAILIGLLRDTDGIATECDGSVHLQKALDIAQSWDSIVSPRD